MNVDVKNALNNVLLICDAASSDTEKDMNGILAKDIDAFIRNISLNNSEEKFDYFSKVYLGGKYKAADFTGANSEEIPELLKLFRSIDTNSINKTGLKTSKVLVALFTILGRSYLSDPYYKRSIDSSRFIELINKMSSYTGSIEADSCKQARSMEIISGEKSTSKVGVQQTDANKENAEEQEVDTEESLEELLKQLDALVGLQGVKKEVREIINLIKVRKKGEEFGEKLPPLSLHLVFYGNPGTGKTTVARLLAKIYKRLGVLSIGQLIEVDRGGLVAGYIGQTATKTQEVIEKAKGGILFIDEAYSLIHGKGETDFGQEAVDTILKAMEDYRDDLIVIVAGYPDLMKEFISSNPGLKSRFNQYIDFPDYKPEELYEIFCLNCQGQNLITDDECKNYLKSHFEIMYNSRKEDFANGRDVRNYFENVLRARANRLAEGDMDTMTKEEYLTIRFSDLQEATNNTKTL